VDDDTDPDSLVDMEWSNHGYDDEFHIVLALIVSLITPDEQVVFDKKVIKLNQTEREYIAQLNDREGVSAEMRAGSQLLSKRLCRVEPEVGAFDTVMQRIAGGNSSDGGGRAFGKELADNWPFHCSETPYWKAVFAKYGVVATCAEKQGHGSDVAFAEFGKEESFWQTYGFLCDLDEPFMLGLWEETCCVLTTPEDVVDVMDNIFGVEELRMEIDDLTVSVSNAKVAYGQSKQRPADVFDFTAINNLLDSI
jgi:hypothetical protein